MPKNYYKYHRNYTHNTNKYVTLKNEIKELIYKGHYTNTRIQTVANNNEPIDRKINLYPSMIILGLHRTPLKGKDKTRGKKLPTMR